MHRNIRLLYAHNFLTDFRFQEAFLVIWFKQITGSYTTAMTILALATITSAILDIPAGIFSDRIGRKYTLIICSISNILMVICFAFAQGAGLLYLGGVFYGLSQCLTNGNNDALLFETLKSEKIEVRFHHFQGRAKSMYQLALCISALCAIIIVPYGLRYVFMFGVIPQVISFFVALFFIEPRTHTEHEKNKLAHLKKALVMIWRNPRLRLMIGARAISNGAGEAFFYFKAAYINLFWPRWAIGLFRGLNHALGFSGFWLAGWVLDRMKSAHVLVLRDVYFFVSQIIAVFIANVCTPIFILSGASFYGPGEIATDVILQKEFTDTQRATMGSVSTFVSSIAYAIAAELYGLVSDHYGVATGFVFGLFLCATSLPIYIYLFRKHF